MLYPISTAWLVTWLKKCKHIKRGLFDVFSENMIISSWFQRIKKITQSFIWHYLHRRRSQSCQCFGWYRFKLAITKNGRTSNLWWLCLENRRVSPYAKAANSCRCISCCLQGVYWRHPSWVSVHHSEKSIFLLGRKQEYLIDCRNEMVLLRAQVTCPVLN